MPQIILDRWAGSVQLINTYGTTECTIWQVRAMLVFIPFTVERLRVIVDPLQTHKCLCRDEDDPIS